MSGRRRGRWKKLRGEPEMGWKLISLYVVRRKFQEFSLMFISFL